MTTNNPCQSNGINNRVNGSTNALHQNVRQIVATNNNIHVASNNNNNGNTNNNSYQNNNQIGNVINSGSMIPIQSPPVQHSEMFAPITCSFCKQSCLFQKDMQRCFAWGCKKIACPSCSMKPENSKYGELVNKFGRFSINGWYCLAHDFHYWRILRSFR